MSKNKVMDIGSKMSFNNRSRSSYSMENLKEPISEEDKIVKIEIAQLEQAPDEWNFYPALSDEEFEKLVLSILEHGLLHPVVVRRADDRNIILSGHNRVRAYQAIVKDMEALARGEEGRYILAPNDELKISDYLQIMCVVKEDISDDEAREIIIDANYVQRQLGPRLITRSVIEKYRIIQDKRKVVADDRYKSLKTREIVARDFKLSGRHIDRYRRLENLDEHLLELFYQGKISLDLASKLAGLKPRVQEHLVENYLPLLSKYPAKVVQEIKSGLSMKDLDLIFENNILPTDRIRVSITENGKTRHILVDDALLIDQIKALVE